MVRGRYFLISLCFFFFISCRGYVDPYPNGRPLDVSKLVEMRYKWKSLNIKNYSFTYIFDTWRPHFCVGDVVVKDGVGTVSFNKEYGKLKPDKDDPYQKFYHITSMEEVFDHMLDRYFYLKKRIDEGKIDYLDYYEEYNTGYFFLEYIVYSTFRPKPLGEIIPDGFFHPTFIIKDFKVLD